MTGKFGTSSSARPGTPLERKFSTFENYQTRVAEEGTSIVNEKLRTKITELDELCLSGKYNISRLSEIREYTTTAVQQYLDDVKRLEKAEAKKSGGGGGNPLLQMLMGGGAQMQGEAEEGEEMYNPEEDQENEEIAMPRRLLLSRMGLDEHNKINLKLSLELELPESAKEAKKAKAEAAEKAEKAEIAAEAEKSKKKREAEEKEAEEPEPKKAKRTTQHSKKNKNKNSKKAEEEEEIEEFEGFDAIDKADEKAENKESSMSVTENEKSESKSKKNEEEDEEEEEEFPVLRSHPEIYKLSTELRRHIDVILDWISTVVQWIQSGMTRNKNIGGADIKTEIQTAMLEELGDAMQEFTSYKEIMGAYYISRAAVLEKYVKSPEFEDYKNFLIDEDEKQFIQIRTIAIGMRNTTVNLFDGLTKQSETIFNFDNNDKQDNYAAFSMY